MDSFDRMIIGELSANCRISFTELAQKHSVSVNTIKKRLEKLVQDNVIVAFDVQIPLEILNGNFAVAYLDLSSGWSKEQVLELGNHPNINAISIGLQSEALVLIVYRNNSEMTNVVDHIRSNPSIERSRAIPLLPPLTYTSNYSTKTLDVLKKIDWRIIQALQRNGRMQLSELSKKVKSSVPSVRKRLNFLRENGLIYETLLVNPGAVSYGIVIVLNVRFQDMAENSQFLVDKIISEIFPDNYWLSWRIADRPELLLVFQSPNAKDVSYLQDRVRELLPKSEIKHQIILGEWEYFPDFRNDVIESNL